MEWFTEMKAGQKILCIINAILIIVQIILIICGVGRVDFYGFGITVGIFTIIFIIFAKGGFQFGIEINTENAGDDVEPSELKYMDWYMKWGFSTLMVIGLIICGLTL